MYDTAKLDKAKSAVEQLDKLFSQAGELNRIPSLFDAIASCFLELENVDKKTKEEAPKLFEVLKLLAEKDLISEEASELADELEEFSEVTGYVDEIQEELDETNSMRSRLHELLNEYLQEVKLKLS